MSEIERFIQSSSSFSASRKHRDLCSEWYSRECSKWCLLDHFHCYYCQWWIAILDFVPILPSPKQSCLNSLLKSVQVFFHLEPPLPHAKGTKDWSAEQRAVSRQWQTQQWSREHFNLKCSRICIVRPCLVCPRPLRAQLSIQAHGAAALAAVPAGEPGRLCDILGRSTGVGKRWGACKGLALPKQNSLKILGALPEESWFWTPCKSGFVTAGFERQVVLTSN